MLEGGSNFIVSLISDNPIILYYATFYGLAELDRRMKFSNHWLEMIEKAVHATIILALIKYLGV